MISLTLPKLKSSAQQNSALKTGQITDWKTYFNTHFYNRRHTHTHREMQVKS